MVLTPMLENSTSNMAAMRNSQTPGIGGLHDVSIIKTIKKNGELQMTQVKSENGRNLVVIKSRNLGTVTSVNHESKGNKSTS